MNHKIHVAFGFHVNCYHSYRGDTNDNLGFGSDIRIIRHIISVLDNFNKNGVPAKATWDTENFFSLEKILPEYAPDIIESMKRRVRENGDENIIMGYNNGALSAMTDKELEASINLARTNPQGSGLIDIFGKCEDIVRPQEVMFTPSQVSVYKKLGIKALCLYYSCVPFDAFRTIIPPLSDEEAFNPVEYTYKGESITIVPTYSNADVCDAGCLRSWVKDLRRQQETGEISRDVLIFINMDADAIFWETMSLPLVKNKIANTDGIHGLIKEIADLPYVVFDTVGGYLKNHGPVCKINFTQDTADGNFTGYASWAEKPYNRKIWTAVDRSRLMSRAVSEDESAAPSFNDRILLLSTTHFGLATPVLNIQRERKADELAAKIIEKEKNALPKSDNITVFNINGTGFQCLQLSLQNSEHPVSSIKLSGEDLKEYAVIDAEDESKTVFVFLRFGKVRKQYNIKASFEDQGKKEKLNSLETKNLKAYFSKNGDISYIEYKGKKLGGFDFLQKYITYDGKDYPFGKGVLSYPDCSGNVQALNIKGGIHLPGETESGYYSYTFFTFPSSDAIFVKTTVKYPYTPETTSISTENSALGRYSDMKWIQAAPFQITPSLKGDIKVVKRNFADDISSFRTASFKESDPENKTLDSFNHQLTCGMVGLTDGEHGIIIANSRQVSGSMAHCPMRTDKDGKVKMNMMGTYYGRQRHHFSRSKCQVLNAYNLIAVQGKSIAPSYNGVCETALLGIFGFSGDSPSEDILKDIKAFSDGAAAVSPENSILTPFYGDNISFKKAKQDNVNENSLKNPIMTGFSGNLGKYIKYGSKAIYHIVKEQIKSK